ncbi:MAG TPA: hypothetical protein PKD70_15290, partial [Saprospiraceae bacterium]|nr:hypothetical protein [Saprospiraceae bacterium]HMP15242.1 hypothetical protein [Saprospiraceae bacterium]
MKNLKLSLYFLFTMGCFINYSREALAVESDAAQKYYYEFCPYGEYLCQLCYAFDNNGCNRPRTTCPLPLSCTQIKVESMIN